MAEITAQLVKQLRDMTGAGMMDCKKALLETDGDIEAAVEFLRKAGIAKAAKKLDREAKDGRIEAVLSEDGKKGAMIALSSETDFVAKNDEFIDFAKKLAMLSMEKAIASVEELEKISLGEKTVSDAITELIAKIGENIKLRKVEYFDANDGGFVLQYIHPGNKVGVMVELSTSASSDERVRNLAKEIAMQIAFSNPVAVSRSEVPQEVIEKEKKLYEEQAREEGKPDAAIPKIVEGRLRKFLEENCLLEQEYIRDSDKKIFDLIDDTSREVGEEISVRRFVRFEIGAA